MDTSELVLRPATAEEFPAMWDCMVDTFAEIPHDSDREAEASLFEPERSLIWLDGGTIVGTGGIVSRDLTVPGAIVALAGVTYITVAPTHRRRGLLTRLITRQLSDLHERQAEPLAGLWASEAAIYQRFGYGRSAVRAILSGDTTGLIFRAGVQPGSGRIRRIPSEEIRPYAEQIYDALRPQLSGHLARPPKWWDRRLADPEHYRQGHTAIRHVIHEEADGRVTGWAAYRIKGDFDDFRPDGTVRIHDLYGLTPQARAALWRHLLAHDLVRHFLHRMAAPDSELPHLVMDPRAVRTELTDSLWLRLVDVDRALAARRYLVDVDVVLEVSDVLCPWNAGRWRLTGGPEGAACVPSTDRADLTLSTTELAAAYLGGVPLNTLAAAGRVTADSPVALRRASTAFGWDSQPWCPEVF